MLSAAMLGPNLALLALAQVVAPSWSLSGAGMPQHHALDVVSCLLRVKIAAGHIVSDLFVQFLHAVWEC